MHRFSPLGLSMLLAASLCTALPSQAAEPLPTDFFEKKIRPVLVQHCYECHSAKAKIVQANLYLDTREGMRRGGDSGPAVVPKEVDESLIVDALRYENFEMPPKRKLPDSVVADFVTWIKSGAPDPRDGKSAGPRVIDLAAGRQHWAYQRPKATTPPTVRDEAWPAGTIDRYLLSKLAAAQLQPVADADSHTLVRRLYLDLIGLPPTAAELQEYAVRLTPAKYEKLVDTLLASPRFGERWGRHWLDVARYAESVGKEKNSPYRLAWRYRDYVIDAFNSDKPYDEFIREQLAGDLLPAESPDERDKHLIATSFLAIGPKALSEQNIEQFLLDIADEQLDVTCRAFLATTAGCARCHDHKFDPIPTTDYYALIGIFRSTECLSGMVRPYREFSYGRTRPLSDKADGADDGNAAVHRDIAGIDAELIRINSEYRAANRKEGRNAERDAAYKQREDDLHARLAAHVSQIENLAKAEHEGGPRFTMGARERDKPADFAVRIRGELADLGPVVPRGFLNVISDERTVPVDRNQSGRLQLAEWIASRDNPLTARVMVNRLWQHLFGLGLVATTDDFGMVGERPSHAELLDYLAVRFMDQGWSVKRMIRELVTSRAYRLSNQHQAEAFATDPDNRLLWRFTRRRLEAETIRDSMLAVSGQLDVQRPLGSLVLTLPNTELGATARGLGAGARYRSVYLPLLRGSVPETLSLFDLADPSLVVGRREVTTVAPQALFLMNSDFVLDHAGLLAKQLMERTELSDADRIDLAYRTALARPASEAERRDALDFLAATPRSAKQSPEETRRSAWTGYCQALLGSAEFRYVY